MKVWVVKKIITEKVISTHIQIKRRGSLTLAADESLEKNHVSYQLDYHGWKLKRLLYLCNQPRT